MGLFTDLTGKLQEVFTRRQTPRRTTSQGLFVEPRWSNSYIYECMLITPVITSMNFITSLLGSQKYIISETGEPVLDTLINNILTPGMVKKIVKNSLNSLIYGFNVMEVVYELTEEGLVTVDSIHNINPLTINNNSFIYSEDDEFLGLQQNSYYDSDLIPKDKLLITRNLNSVGVCESNLFNIRKEIHAYKSLIDNWDLYISKKTVPTTVITTDVVDPQEIEALEQIAKAENEAKGGTLIVGEGTTITTLLEAGNQKTAEFESAKESLRNDVFERFGILQLMTNTKSSTDSYAKSSQNTENTFKVLNDQLGDIENLLNDLIQTITEFNYLDVEPPTIKFNRLHITDWKTLFDILNSSQSTPIQDYDELIQKMIEDTT